MTYYLHVYDSPVGPLHLVADDEELHGIHFAVTWPEAKRRFADLEERATPLLRKAATQLDEYFAGERREFDLPLALNGTAFQNRAWRALARIPFGETRTYAQQAATIKAPTATRAVGAANGKNPFCIVLPCHRVLGSNGKLTGFAGGLDTKRFLLTHERPMEAR